MASDGPVPSVKKNYVFNSLQNISTILFPLVSFAYISRVLGPEMFGKVVFASSFTGYFALLAGLGIPLYGAREIAKARGTSGKASTVFSELFVIGLLSTLASLVLFVVPLLTVDKIQKETVLFLVTGGIVVANFFSIDWLFQGLEQYGNIALRSVFFKALSLALLFIAVRRETDYLWYAATSVVAVAGSNIAGFLMARKHVRLTFSGLSIRHHLRPIVVLFSVVCTVCVYIYLDSVILGFLAGNNAVGLYSAASKITRTVVVVVTSVSMVLVPRISYYLKNNMLDEYRTITQKSIYFILFLALPLSVGLFLCAPDILALFTGNRFAEAALTIRITSPLIVVIGLSNFFSLQILYPNGEENKLFIAVLCAAAVDVAFNFALIPLLSYNGTAIASLAAEMTALGVMILMCRKRYLTFRLIDKRVISYGAASLGMGVVVLFVLHVVRNPLLSAACACASGAASYAGLLYVMRDPLMREITDLVRNRGVAGVGLLFSRER
jgi:O-antigen/teichoic acid export membrane protein